MNIILNMSLLYILTIVCARLTKIFAIKCEDCCYNVLGFARNYFTSISCGCKYINKNVACSHCRQLINSLNQCVRKVCLKPEDVRKEFKLEEIDKYLEKHHLKADQIFYYSKEEKKILNDN